MIDIISNNFRCKWCHKLIISEKLQSHEENCDLNDGGASDLNYEGVANKYFD